MTVSVVFNVYNYDWFVNIGDAISYYHTYSKKNILHAMSFQLTYIERVQ